MMDWVRARPDPPTNHTKRRAESEKVRYGGLGVRPTTQEEKRARR
jgi:hypothetical protein